jgi:fibronectin type III domain protein
MRSLMPVAVIFALGLSALAAPTREVKTRSVRVDAPLPEDLLHPEGKTRWHLEALPLGAAATVAIDDGNERLTSGSSTFGGRDRSRWALPDRDPSQMKMGARVRLELDQVRGERTERLEIDLETIGIGWAHLPSGPREVVLQRALVRGELLYRWVDPRAGVVAQVAGPASASGRDLLEVREASVVEEVVLGAADLKIYSDELERGTYAELKYGWDKGAGTAVSSMVPDPGIANICDLVNLNSWNFSGTTTGSEIAYYQTPLNSTETCNAARCPAAGGVLGREDRNISATLRKDNQVTERENRPTDVTIWLRGGTQNENVGGAFGTGESGFCFNTTQTITRKPVPLWRFSHDDNDGNGYYLQAGDSWEMQALDQPGDCQETFYTTKCGVPQFLTPNPLYARACTSSGQTHLGKHSIQIVKGGVVTLPSGHTLNALVVRNTTDFCVYSSSSCGSPLDRVRTVVYYWQVPYLGSVALMRSPKTVNYTAAEMTAGATTPCTNITTLDYTNIAFGLFPPLSITAGTATDTSVQISWSPGNDTHRISGYKVYWDTDPGASSPYAFNSATHPGQVAFAGTSATISGLTPGTNHYVTVTSLSTYTDPSSSITTTYESIVYPTTVSGDPSFAYPVEVQKTTTGGTCIPSAVVNGLTVDKAGANVHVCWTATADACAVGYDALGSSSATSPAGFTVVGQVGLTTCWDGNPSQSYFLVRSRGTGGNGPWGHYGQ